MDLEQEKVIEFVNGPAAVLAGAGSGKTRTLIKRIERLVELTDPSKIVMLTFTNTAADEMKERAAKVNEKCEKVIACTYHKYCGRILRIYGRAIGIDPSFEVLTEMKYHTLIEYVKSQNEYYEELKDFPSSTRLASIFSTLINNEDMTIEEIVSGTKYFRYAQDIMKLYGEVRQYGLQNQKLSFDDMLLYMNQLLDIPEICQKVANTFTYLMVDEFQDTNKLQLDILLKLGKYNQNIVIVGDISQSIYKFRGARVKNIVNFIKAFDNCKKFTLSTNYRSTQEILDAANEIMNTYADWEYTNMKAHEKHGVKPSIKRCISDTEQAHWIIDTIQAYHAAGLKYSEMAILERKSMSSFKLENELTKAKIHFEKRGGKKFTEYVVVDDLLSFMSVVTKNDHFGWFNILCLVPGVGKKTATEISNHCNEYNFIDLYAKRKFYPDLVDFKRMLDSLPTEDLQAFLTQVSEYYFAVREAKIENSKMTPSAKFDAKEKLDRDRKVAQALKDMTEGYNSINEFLDDLALDAVKSADDDEEVDKLVISTIHSAKGLEWQAVILIDCIEESTDDEYEDLRCLYVAMTRAKGKLILSIPSTVFMNGQTKWNDFSHFINEKSDKFIKEK